MHSRPNMDCVFDDDIPWEACVWLLMKIQANIWAHDDDFIRSTF